MRFNGFVLGIIGLLFTAPLLAQTIEYSRKVNGSASISAGGTVTTFTIDPAGVPDIDQALGNLVKDWRFKPAANPAAAPVAVDFVMTLTRESLSGSEYVVKRVEITPRNAVLDVTGANSPDELAYCRQVDAAPRDDVLCPAVLPKNAELEAIPVSAEVFVALRQTANGPEVVIESLYLYSNNNSKMFSKFKNIARPIYKQAALDWVNKNAMAFLKDKQYFVARIEYVQVENDLSWRRNERTDGDKIDWITEAIRNQVMYVTQGGLQML